MIKRYSFSFSTALTRALLALLLVASQMPAAAQAPAWQSARAVAAATAAVTGNYSEVTATAVDATGNVYLAGSFRNSVTFGGTTLNCIGGTYNDVFVAKFNPTINQFVWAQRAGGTGEDLARKLAVSGSSIYVTGDFNSPVADFGSTMLSNAGSFVAKLTDAGNTGSFVWALRAGGTGSATANALAVSGTSIYVAGSFGPTASFGLTTLASAGGATGVDVYVAKLTDAGSFVWAQRGGGVGSEAAQALAVSGTSVYLTGVFDSSPSVFGPVTIISAGSLDMYVAKLTDTGSTGNFVWAQRAGGIGADEARALAVSGTSIYLAGTFASATAAFGAIILTSAGSYDVCVAKLTDAGSTGNFVWAQQAGGFGFDIPAALAVNGANVYVTGSFSFAPVFGTTTLTSAGAQDAFIAKLADAGSSSSFAWAQRAGGTGGDVAYALAISGTSMYVAGAFNSPTADFSSTILNAPTSNADLGFLATLTDPTLTATAPGRALAPAQLFPNPARHAATLRLPAGTAPAPLTLTDALGRPVRRYPAPASLEAMLDLWGLPAGLYLLRGAGPAQRLTVE